MAGESWSITIVPGAERASFVPDVYTPPGKTVSIALQAQIGDCVSWNNQTNQEHEIWEQGGGQLSEQIDPFRSSTPGYIVALTGKAPGTVNYYCSIHPEETGSIDVIS
jgi:plastocyanin